MAAPTGTTTTARPARRADAGTVRLSQRDIDGLLLCGEHYGTPYDLPAPRGAVLYRPRSGQRWEELSLDQMANPRPERRRGR
jgi:hypothetical protein